MGTFFDNFIVPAGIYAFRIIEAIKRLSRVGNVMWELHHRVEHEGRYSILKNLLVITEESLFMIRNFFHSIGRPERFDQGNWKRADFIFQEGLLMCYVGKNSGRSVNVIYDYALEG